MEVDEGSDQISDVYPQWIAAHACLKIKFTEGNKCHNLMSRLISDNCKLNWSVASEKFNAETCTPVAYIWATTWQNQQSDCAQSAQSDQSLRCALNG